MTFTAPVLGAPAAEALAWLAGARAAGRPCAPVRTLLPAGDIGTAYAVQSAWVAAQVAGGDRVVGRKIGLTNPVVQAQLGVDQPDFGALLATMDCPQGKPVDTSRLLQPRIEAEVAFVLARDLDEPDIGPGEVLAATEAVVAALEIVDSRVAGWDISIVDTVADNASSGLFILGPERITPDGLDLASCPMRLWRGRHLPGGRPPEPPGEEVSAGSGAACLGHPAAAVAWLAVTARSYGQPLRAGEIVLSGALGPMVPVAAGDRFTADIGGLGQVSAVFAGSAP
ncbi:MAG: 2-keto-4-pentenoate hydratase [Trebonia sp.]|jgi:2-keto-4-pentenoate hydratase|nr:2-keto-4-pentenoate hydratase [Trebonia sp.]